MAHVPRDGRSAGDRDAKRRPRLSCTADQAQTNDAKRGLTIWRTSLPVSTSPRALISAAFTELVMQGKSATDVFPIAVRDKAVRGADTPETEHHSFNSRYMRLHATSGDRGPKSLSFTMSQIKDAVTSWATPR